MSIVAFQLKIPVFVLFLFFANAVCADRSSDVSTSEINEFNIDDISNGVYNFRFITAENIQREENGHLDDEGNLVIDGYYSYTDPDGNQQHVSYHADKNGYRTIKIPEPSIVVAAGIDSNIVASLLG